MPKFIPQNSAIILSVAGLQIILKMQTTCAFDQAGRPPRLVTTGLIQYLKLSCIESKFNKKENY